jgi:redox-sensing transcriptional repressor
MIYIVNVNTITRRPMSPKRIPSETIDRLFLYMRGLTCLLREGTRTVSSQRLAEICRVKAAAVRKDLSYFGGFGTRGVGYDVEELMSHLRRILKYDDVTDVALVGVGNIGRALLTHSDFELEGFRIVTAFDSDPDKIDTKVGGVTVEDIDHMVDLVRELGLDLVILAVPDNAAPKIAHTLERAGVSSILSFSPCDLFMPHGIEVTCIDLSMEMARLLYHSRRRNEPAEEVGV